MQRKTSHYRNLYALSVILHWLRKRTAGAALNLQTTYNVPNDKAFIKRRRPRH
jgi:hypothetical protein